MRGFFRFRLSTFLLLVVCLAISFAWWKDHGDLRRELEDAKGWRQVLRDAGTLRGQLSNETVRDLGMQIWESELRGRARHLGVEVDNRDSVALERTVQLLDDPSPLVRQAATWCLGQLAAPDVASEIVKHLTQALRDSDDIVRGLAVQGLKQFSGPAFFNKTVRPLARTILEDRLTSESDPYVVLEIVDALDHLASRANLFAKTCDLMTHSDAAVRCDAVRRLGRVGKSEARRATSLLLQILADDESYVRSEAALVIGDLGEVAVAVPALQKAHRQEEDPGVRRSIANALAHLEANRRD
jgi:HEAT repeat protein